ncbi:hypothetical protein TrST_g13899 [Triparma strigata]|uniref:Uncharacterized protein n=1 Tax=Triparma strigata TaxID=1606541 RepID=A0A9W7B9J4_9STRA|nr:hypothetical protein TrST_g13899 [Triparma strigata]
MNAHEKASLNEAYKAARRLKALEGVSEKHVNAYKAVHKGIRAVLPVPPRNDKKGKVIQEILLTEESYVESLDVLVSVFEQPTQKYLHELANKSAQHMENSVPLPPNIPPPLVASELLNQHNKIFGNISLILKFNEVFLSMLRDASTPIAEVFKKNSDFFKMYSDYCRKFEVALSQIKSWKEGPWMSGFIRACELQPACEGLDLNSYLIMPVQRIPRYKMLLAELIKLTPEKNGNMMNQEHKDLSDALSVVSSVATKLNDDMKRFETKKQVLEFAQQFEKMELVLPARYFVKSGVLKKVCRGGKKDFTFVLFNDLLIYGSPKLGITKSAPNGEKIHSLHREISLHNTYIVKGIRGFMEGFILVAHQKSFYVDCGSAVEANIWIDKFEQLYQDLDDPKKITKKSSWREEGDEHFKEQEIRLWGHQEDKDGVDYGDTEFWKLNRVALGNGHGVIEAIDKEEIEGGLGTAIAPPGIAHMRTEYANGERNEDGTPSRRSSASSKISSVARRMSQKFGTSFRVSKSSSEPEIMTSASSSLMDSGIRFSESSTSVSPPPAPVETRPQAKSFTGPAMRVNSQGHFTPKQPPAPSVPLVPRNQFIDDAAVKYSGEFRVMISTYGLGLDLLDVSSPYQDHPSPSIVQVVSFPNLPNRASSPGASAGIKVGDYIVMINGVGVAMAHQFLQVLRDQRIKVNDTVTVRIRRGGVYKPHAKPDRLGAVKSKSMSTLSSTSKSTSPTADLLGLGDDGSGNTILSSAQSPAGTVVSIPTLATHRRAPALNNSVAGEGQHRKFSLNHGSAVRKSLNPPSKPPSRPARRQDDWMNNNVSSSELDDSQKRLSEKLGTPEGFDPLNLKEIEFLNLFGITKHKYIGMEENERVKLRSELGL